MQLMIDASRCKIINGKFIYNDIKTLVIPLSIYDCPSPTEYIKGINCFSVIITEEIAHCLLESCGNTHRYTRLPPNKIINVIIGANGTKQQETMITLPVITDVLLEAEGDHEKMHKAAHEYYKKTIATILAKYNNLAVKIKDEIT